jgi:hypothetical protein
MTTRAAAPAAGRTARKRRPQRKTAHRRMARWLKRAAWTLGGMAVLSLLAAGGLMMWANTAKVPPSQIAWGVTFSAGDARGLGLDPQSTYKAILDDLRPKRLRLVAYWTDIEPAPGQHDFSDLDWQVSQAEQRGIPYVIVVGRKVPRWPECYTPDWAKVQSNAQQQQDLLDFITRTITRYNANPHLLRWQIENEPFLNFGDHCAVATSDQLISEVALAHRLSTKPVMITDSGETSTWLHSSQYPDVLGSTLYRVVLNSKGQAFHHFLPPDYYTLHAMLVRKLHPNIQQVVIAELQAEPWTQIGLPGLRHAYIDQTLSHQQFQGNINFARQVGLPEVYFWGAEWWYYEKLQGGDPYYWNSARDVFLQSAP